MSKVIKMNKYSKLNEFAALVVYFRLFCIGVFFFIFSLRLVFAGTAHEQVCFNFYVMTKGENNYSEKAVFKKQKELLYKQIENTQRVFDKNKTQNCPKIRFSQGEIKQIRWNDARRLSQPLDQKINESEREYKDRKLFEASAEIVAIAETLAKETDIKYVSFIGLAPGQAILKAERAIEDIEYKLNIMNAESRKQELENLLLVTRAAIKQVKEKLDADKNEANGIELKRAEAIIKKYEKIDQLTADSWREGILTFWNDKEAQDTSIELKNLLRYYRTPSNQCLDVYSVPDGRSPSINNSEFKKNGDWTRRGGAAILSRLFPRTTGGAGHAIVLTQNLKASENRLAHELAHLLIDNGNAHLGKKSDDLMYEKSEGGSYLNENECGDISENIKTFFGGPDIRNETSP